MDEGFRLWGMRCGALPPRPDDPGSFPESDARHWYDLEYAGRFGERDPESESPGDGPAGERIVCLRPGPYPYMTLYDAGMTAEAARCGMELEIRGIDWSEEAESRSVRDVVGERPDLAVVVPDDMHESAEILARFHAAHIPVIASNLKPGPESLRYDRTRIASPQGRQTRRDHLPVAGTGRCASDPRGLGPVQFSRTRTRALSSILHHHPGECGRFPSHAARAFWRRRRGTVHRRLLLRLKRRATILRRTAGPF